MKKIPLICVCNDCLNLAFFRKEDKLKAADFLSNYIKEQAEKGFIEDQYEIKIVRINESEVESYLNL